MVPAVMHYGLLIGQFVKNYTNLKTYYVEMMLFVHNFHLVIKMHPVNGAGLPAASAHPLNSPLFAQSLSVIRQRLKTFLFGRSHPNQFVTLLSLFTEIVII